ncbi:sigma-70 family RNA polymerase sigma factor [uncultured Azohydromonas sp.]|uniref:RNA polymerase sigma factor n=1 Tax=uncultured Azohydromonas sp. TaxID=487342 RepID=UPI0026150AE0|nr:sigma-70 family RNA polymerase sigma factor [uncultured Azohydromonas sp.]
MDAEEAQAQLPLVAHAAAGDRSAYATLVRQFQHPLFAFLGRMGLRQAEAEELAQDAFIRAWQHLPHYRAEHQRQHTGHPAAEDDGAACDAPGPAQALQSRQQQAQLQAALRRLSPDDRSVLALAYVHELTLADVARIEDCSPAAAKARLHRARERLRQALAELDLHTLE